MLVGCNDAGNTTPAPTPTPTINKSIFMTVESYDGNLGGIAGADADCATEAESAGLSGTYKALIVESQRYPCDESGDCGSGSAKNWPLAVNTSYANASNNSTIILTTNANGVFESSYARNLIKTPTGANMNESTSLFWTGISGVNISGTSDITKPAVMNKWSYANESQNWGPANNWASYATYNCNGWTSNSNNWYSSFGDNGRSSDSSYQITSSLNVGQGYSMLNVRDELLSESAAPSRWLARIDHVTGASMVMNCNYRLRLICVQQ